MSTTKRPWYRKKRFNIPLGIVGLFVIVGLLNPSSEPEEPVASPAASEEATEPSSTPSAESTELTAEELAAQEEADRLAAEQAAAEEAERVEAERIAAEEEAAAEAERVEAERIAAEQAAAEEAAEEAAAAAEAAAEEAARGTVSQQNALGSAESYLEFSAFSRSGLIEQLTSEYGEGFPAADAEFAVNRLEAEGRVDWNEQAAESAKSYLELSSFSRDGLIEQLTSEYGEGFTAEQAEYGVSQTGL